MALLTHPKDISVNLHKNVPPMFQGDKIEFVQGSFIYPSAQSPRFCSFARKNGHPFLICSSLSTEQLSFLGGPWNFHFKTSPILPSFRLQKKNIKNIFQMLNGMGIFVYQKNGWNERGGSGRRPQGKYSHPNWAHGASGNMIAIDFFEHFAPKTPLEQMEGVFLPKKWKVFITHENQGCGFPYHINILTCLSWPWKKSSILSLCI